MIFYGHWPANFKEQGRRAYTAEHIGQAGKNVTQWENERQERSHHTMSIPIQLLYSYVVQTYTISEREHVKSLVRKIQGVPPYSPQT